MKAQGLHLTWFQPLLPAIEKRINTGETVIEIR
jgi:hypothetical protein